MALRPFMPPAGWFSGPTLREPSASCRCSLGPSRAQPRCARTTGCSHLRARRTAA